MGEKCYTVKLNYGIKPSQFGILTIPSFKKRYPLIVTIHGGFWKAKYGLEELQPLTSDLNKRGFATWNVEYRRVGQEDSGWPGTFNDVIDAINLLKKIENKWPVDINDVIIIGHSAGGHLALWSAFERNGNKLTSIHPLLVPIRAVVSLAGISILRDSWLDDMKKGNSSPVSDFMNGAPVEKSEEYKLASPFDLLPMGTPQILVHGLADSIVPYKMTSKYAKKCQKLNDNMQLITEQNSDHFDLIDPNSKIWKQTITSIVRILN